MKLLWPPRFLIAATPEPQYIPVMLYLALFGIFWKLGQRDARILRWPPLRASR